MPLGHIRYPFSHPDWIFEVKWDGFRSLVHLDRGVCRLVSRNGNELKSFPALNDAISGEFRARSAVLDGELVCLDRYGKTQFTETRGAPPLRFRPALV